MKPSPTTASELFQNAEALFTKLSSLSIPHVLVGGLALLTHTDGRNTEDVDLIMALPDLTLLPDLLVEDSNEWFARACYGSLQVDLLFTANPLFSHVLANHSAKQLLQGRELNVATAEGLLLLKLYALPSLYRQGQTGRAAMYESDIALLLLSQDVPDHILLACLSSHMTPSDIAALQEVLQDVRTRLRRRF